MIRWPWVRRRTKTFVASPPILNGRHVDTAPQFDVDRAHAKKAREEVMKQVTDFAELMETISPAHKENGR